MLPRNVLPQIPKEHLLEFRDFLIGNGIDAKFVRHKLHELTPIQKHLNPDKVKRIMGDPDAMSIPLVTTESGHVLDGHHRWGAHMAIESPSVNCLECACSLRELIEIAHQFPYAEIKSLHEYKRNYKQEYARYHSRPDQKKRRAQRNAARHKMTELGHVKKGDGLDVHHRNHDTSDNRRSNLAAIDRHKNRGALR